MISKREIKEISTSKTLRPHVVEKDYVLGWILAGINQHEIGKSWVFKGGTCLKKCYFETYRFSEDLDFTLVKEDHLNAGFLKNVFSEIAEWVYENSGIEIPVEKLLFDVYKNPRGNSSCQGKVYYKGPLAPQSEKSMPRIKLDLTADEVLVKPSVINLVKHEYTDTSEDLFKIQSYGYKEIFAEKIRALGERSRPRDLYDVINFYRRPESENKVLMIQNILKEKCTFKGINLPDYPLLESHKQACSDGWEQQLKHQLPFLPPFESFWDELELFFMWLENKIKTTQSQPIGTRSRIAEHSITDINKFRSVGANMLDSVRFASTNHLCIELDYQKENGIRKTYTVEPYSLRQTSEGNLLLYTLEYGTKGPPKSFRVDRIMEARISKLTFIPAYTVEFIPSIIEFSGKKKVISPMARKTTAPRIKKIKTLNSSIPIGRKVLSGRKIKQRVIKYSYQCPYCEKKFHRIKQNNKLNAHKNKNGWDCPGKTGLYIGRRY